MDETDAAVGHLVRLIEAAAPEQRARVANWIGEAIGDTTFVGPEGLILARITETLCRDEAINVRQILSEHVLHNEHLPPAIARRMAQDVDSIAVPFIRRSEALTDPDLLRLVRQNNTLRQLSVARRDQVSQSVSHALIDTGKMPIVKGLVANSGAEIHEADFDLVLRIFGNVASVTHLLARRMDLPNTIARQLGRTSQTGAAQRRPQLAGASPHWLSKS